MCYNRLKGYRARNGLSQDDMAKLLNISRTSYNRKENNKDDFLKSQIDIMLKLFNTTYEDLFFKDDVPKMGTDD